jgi:hypothetical protein
MVVLLGKGGWRALGSRPNVHDLWQKGFGVSRMEAPSRAPLGFWIAEPKDSEQKKPIDFMMDNR